MIGRTPPLQILLVLALGLAATGPAAAEEKVRAFRAAAVHVSPGTVLAPGWLIVKGRSVEAVLPGTESPPAGAEVIELGDAVVLPGLVNPLSSIADSRGGRGESGAASSGGGGPRDTRAALASAAIQKPDASFLKRLGRTGYAAIAWLPDASGFLPGHAVVIHPHLGTEKEAAALVVKDAPYLLLGFEMGRRWREVVEAELKKATEAIAKEAEAKRQAEEARKKAEEAKAAEARKAAETKEQEKKDAAKKEPEKKETEKKDAPPAPAPAPAAPPAAPPAPPKPPDPLVKVLKGEMPLFVRVRSAAALDHFFRLLEAASVKLRFTLVTGALPPEGVEKVAARRDQVEAVILEPRVESIPSTSVLFSTARLFIERGVPVAFVPLSDTIDGHAEMLLRLAEVIKAGVPPVDALRAVTTVPARLLGLEGKVGSLEKGAAASFAVYRGEPLAGAARLELVVLEGTEVYRDEGGAAAVTGEAVR